MESPRPLLYTYRRCPYAMRARMALMLAGVAFDAYEIVLRAKPQGLLQASPKGTVPVLVLPDGMVLEQSWDIVRWALSSPAAAPAARQCWIGAEAVENQKLLELNDNAFKHLLDRYKYPERFSLTADACAEAAQDTYRRQAVAVFLEPLEQRLAGAPYLGGEAPCATDIATFPFVRQFAAVDPAWFAAMALPRVQSWLHRWVSSALFQGCMAKLTSNTQQPFPLPSA